MYLVIKTFADSIVSSVILYQFSGTSGSKLLLIANCRKTFLLFSTFCQCLSKLNINQFSSIKMKYIYINIKIND